MEAMQQRFDQITTLLSPAALLADAKQYLEMAISPGDLATLKHHAIGDSHMMPTKPLIVAVLGIDPEHCLSGNPGLVRAYVYSGNSNVNNLSAYALRRVTVDEANALLADWQEAMTVFNLSRLTHLLTVQVGTLAADIDANYRRGRMVVVDYGGCARPGILLGQALDGDAKILTTGVSNNYPAVINPGRNSWRGMYKSEFTMLGGDDTLIGQLSALLALAMPDTDIKSHVISFAD